MAYTRDEFNNFIQEDLTSDPYPIPWSFIGGVGVPLAAFSAGFAKIGNSRLWDFYFRGIRHLEEALPMGIGATFRLSESISPLASPSGFELLHKDHSALLGSRGFQNYLSQISGKNISELEDLGAFSKGIYWKKTGSSLGELHIKGGPRIADSVAAISTGPRRGGFLVEWLSRVTGVKDPTFFKRIKESEEYLRPSWLPAAYKGKAGAKFAGKFGYALLSSAIGRMNLLLQSPLDLEAVSEVAKKVPVLGKIKLGVKPGTGMQMLGRYAGKAAITLMGLQALRYADHISREYKQAGSVPVSGLLGAGIGAGLGWGKGKAGRYGLIGAGVGALLGLSGEGPISGLGNLYAKARVFQAQVSTTLGLAEGARETEDYFPGLTKPATLVAAAGVGLLLGGVKEWGNRLKVAREVAGRAKITPSGDAARSIYERAAKQLSDEKEFIYKSYSAAAEKGQGLARLSAEINRKFAGSMKGGKFRPSFLSKYVVGGIAAYEAFNVVGSLAAGDIGGAITQGATALGSGYAYLKGKPGIAAALLLGGFLLREKESPTKLENIYSGKELVEVRKGRWWEGGKTDYEGGRAYYRPHRVAMMQKGVQEAAVYGSESDYWATKPYVNPLGWLWNPYKAEELMWQQGYKFPVSKTPFEDMPVLGPVLSATVGQILKPSKYMGIDEWIEEEREVGPRGMQEIEPEEPVRKTGLTATIGEQIRRIQELSGLPGFMTQAIKEKITGDQAFFTRDQWATPSLVSGTEPGWWSLEMGGMAMLCLPEGSLIQVSDGIKRIESIDLGDKVLSKDGNYYRVKGISKREENSLYSFYVSSLDRRFKCTGNHIVPVIKKERCTKDNIECIPGQRGICHFCKEEREIKTVDIPADQIEIGDWLEVPLSEEKEEVYLDEFSYLLGWYVIRGRHLEESIFIDYSSKEEKYINKLIKIAIRVDPKVKIYRWRDQSMIQFESPFLLEEVFKYIKEEDIRSIKSSLNSAPRKVKEDFMRAVLIATRTINSTSVCNKLLLTQIYLLSLSLGFRGNITSWKALNYIEWSESTESLIEAFINGHIDNIYIHGRNENSFIENNKLYVRVLEINKIENNSSPVYDLCIEGLHYFTSEFICVHNSEGIRRYIPRRRSDIEYKNPLPSDLPSWLPGPDSNYFLDFSKASIYQKIDEPWARLPGKGLEELYPELKNVHPEVYSDFWKYKVLSDVAVFSKEQAQYEEKLSEMAAQGRLSARELMEFQKIKSQVKEARRAKRFQQYRYDSNAIEKTKVRITEEVSPGMYLTDTFGSAPISLTGIDTSAASLANIAMREEDSLSSQEAMNIGIRKRAQISDFLRQHLYPGAEVDVFVHKDKSLQIERNPAGKPIVPAIVSVGGTNLNRELIERGLAENISEGELLDPAAATGGIQRSIGAFWENLAHNAETPLESFLPVSPVGKFVHQRSPLEEYRRTEVYGRDVALWEKPIRHFLAPGLSTTAFWAGWRGLPTRVKERYMTEEYFDRLKYEKWKRLEQVAISEGKGREASKNALAASRTKTGGNIYSEKSIMLALSSKERAYFKEFVEAPTAQERREISNVVSPQMKDILHAQWRKRASEAAAMRIESGIGTSGDVMQVRNYTGVPEESRMQARMMEQEAIQRETPMPGPRWVGWEREAQLEDYKVKTVLDKEMDLADFGIWPSDIRRVEARPWVESITLDHPQREQVSITGLSRKFSTHFGPHRSWNNRIHLRPGAERRINVHSPGRDRLDRYLRDPSILTF